MKKLRLGFIITLLLSLAALIFAACGKDLPPLEKPANVRQENGFLVWDGAENAAGYTVEIGGVSYGCAETRFDLSVLTDPASYIIRVKSNGDGKNFSDSAWVSRGYTLKAEDMFFLLIEGGSAYELSRAYAVKDSICEIPRTYNGRPVTAIGAEAFKDNIELVSISIPEGVTVIKESAFEGCTALESVTLPESLREIGKSAFKGSGLTAVTIPDKIQTIPSAAFRNCASLESVTLPDSLKAIENEAFCSCKRYAPNELPQSLTKIGNSALAYTAIRSIAVPSGVTELGDHAFAGCAALESISLPDGLQKIGSSFYECTALKNITIPDSVMEMDGNTFSGCTALESVVLSDNIPALRSNVFKNCTSLREVHLPAALNAIWGSAFENCAALESLRLPDRLENIYPKAFWKCTALTEITFPNSLDYVGCKLFSRCPWYEALPDGPIYLGPVLYSYKGVIPENTHLVIKEGTRSVSPYALNATCALAEGSHWVSSNVTGITLPESMEVLCPYAFSGSRVKEIAIPKRVKFIGCNVLNDTQSIKFENRTGWSWALDGVLTGGIDEETVKPVSEAALSDPEQIARLFELVEMGPMDIRAPMLYRKDYCYNFDNYIKNIDLPIPHVN